MRKSFTFRERVFAGATVCRNQALTCAMLASGHHEPGICRCTDVLRRWFFLAMASAEEEGRKALSRGGSGCPWASCEAPGNPAANRPGHQPRYRIPVRPAFVPIRDARSGPHHFTENEEPEDIATRLCPRKVSTDPGTQHRDHHEECSAREQGGVRGNMPSDEISGKKAGKQRVRRQDKNN